MRPSAIDVTPSVFVSRDDQTDYKLVTFPFHNKAAFAIRSNSRDRRSTHVVSIRVRYNLSRKLMSICTWSISKISLIVLIEHAIQVAQDRLRVRSSDTSFPNGSLTLLRSNWKKNFRGSLA